MLNMIKRAYYYYKTFANWIDVIKQIKSDKDNIIVYFRNSTLPYVCNKDCIHTILASEMNGLNPNSFLIKNNKLYYKNNLIQKIDSTVYVLFQACGFVYADGLWYFNDIKFKYINYSVYETFCKKQYNINVKGREVLDIGANIGDTPIYFISKGAYHVYAFEPLPYNYFHAKENISLNNFESKITLINGAVGAVSGFINIPAYVDNTNGFSIYKSYGDNSLRIKLYSFNEAVKLMKDRYLLKMDCEGCEKEIILNNNFDFERIIFGSHEDITGISTKLLINIIEKQGYKCVITNKMKGEKLVYCIRKV